MHQKQLAEPDTVLPDATAVGIDLKTRARLPVSHKKSEVPPEHSVRNGS